MFQILVAEDDKNTRRLMEAVLKEHGYHPILACEIIRYPPCGPGYPGHHDAGHGRL